MQNTSILGFTIQHKLGEGGMAEVWYAENKIGKAAAIKVLKKEFINMPTVVARFENEAKTMVTLNHPNIRQVLDYEVVNGQPCIVMEYLEGGDLKNRLNNGQKFSDTDLRNWWNQCVDALNYTHAKGVVHRDIKPANIFVTNHGIIKILDFGIAKAQDNIMLTQTGMNLGTLLYMSPEQIKDSKHIDYKTDVYSLAVTFFHLLSGNAPYDSDTSSAFEIQTKIVKESLDLSCISEYWQQVLICHMHKDPEMRHSFIQKERPNISHETSALDPDSTRINTPNNHPPAEILNKPDSNNSLQRVSLNPNWVFYEGRAIISRAEKYGFVDLQGNIIVPTIYDEVLNFSQSRARVRMGKKWGYIDLSGIEIIAPTFDNCGDFHEGFSWVFDGKNCRYIDVNGFDAFHGQFTYVDDFYNGYAVVGVGFDKMIIDQHGNIITTDSYSEIMPFKGYDNLFLVYYKWGVNNIGLFHVKKGLLINPVLCNISVFNDEINILKLSRRDNNYVFGLYCFDRGVILPVEYEIIKNIEFENYFIIKRKGYYGIFHLNEGIVLPSNYSIITKIGNDYYCVEKKKVFNINITETGFSISPNDDVEIRKQLVRGWSIF